MEPNPGSAAKSSAAYGHSCANCVKAKCKCIPRGIGSCERCHRLAKDCQPATFVRKRGAKKATSSTVRKSQLEDKLDSLVSLLQAQNTTPRSTRPSNGAQSAFAACQIAPDSSQQSRSCSLDVLPTPGASEASAHTSPLSGAELEHAEQTLSTFRTRFLKLFPFMHLTEETSVEQLQRERPITCRAIRAACEGARNRQNELGSQVREEVTRRLVANGERSLDLLLATFVCSFWQFYFTAARPSLGMFSSVARSLVFDLRLDRPGGAIFMGCPKVPSLIEQPELSATRTDEERRALVSCFSLSAMVTMSLKYEPMRWSPQIEDSCRRLSQNFDIPGDQVLVAITRISKVSVEASNMVQRLFEDPAYGAHALLNIRSLTLMLDQVKFSLTTEQLQNKLVLCYLHSTEVLIHEGALSNPPTSPLAPETIDLQRTEYLSACLQAAKATLDNYLSINTVSINMPTVLSFSHAAQVLFKLSVIDIPGWDGRMARATADVIWYLEQVAKNLDLANETLSCASGGAESVFLKGGDTLRGVIGMWKDGLDSATAAAGMSAESEVLEGDAATGFDPTDTSWLNFPDDVWFADVFGQRT